MPGLHRLAGLGDLGGDDAGHGRGDGQCATGVGFDLFLRQQGAVALVVGIAGLALPGQFLQGLLQLRDAAAGVGGLLLQGLHGGMLFQRGGFLLFDLQGADKLVALQLAQPVPSTLMFFIDSPLV